MLLPRYRQKSMDWPEPPSASASFPAWIPKTRAKLPVFQSVGSHDVAPP